MSPEPQVDLLLVRLGREEEKKRVRHLLVTSLQMTEDEASRAVESSPTVLREAVPMAEARDIQKKLYPFIDLLPRIDETTAPPPPPIYKEEPEDRPRQRKSRRLPGSDTEGDDDFVGSEYIDSIAESASPPEVPAESEITPGAAIEDFMSNMNAAKPQARPGEDEFLITSASEEMLQIERCHVCGRTPQDGERLAPCRTCGELTCRDCFDRIAHVCEKCASEGKIVSTPLQGTPEYLASHDHHLDQEELPKPERTVRKPAGTPGVMKLVVPLVVLIGLAAVFYLVDPMNLFSGETGNGSTVVPVDTTSVPDTAVVQPDTTGPVNPDTVTVTPDTTTVVATLPLGLNSLTLPDTIEIPASVPVIQQVDRFGSQYIEMLADEQQVLADPLAQIAAVGNVTVDMYSVIRIDGEHTLLVLSILHPEDNTNRYNFLNMLASFIRDSDVDQLVFYYRENRFQNTSILTYTSDVFPDLEVATSPQQFQLLAGSIGGNVWDLVSGEIQEKLTVSQQ